MLTIGPFGYDPADQCLWKDGERVELTPKTFAVLTCLVSRAGRLVTKEELIQTVGPEVCVTDAVLKVRIAELRKLLREEPGKRRFIETLHRRGYRLVAPVGHAAERAVVRQASPAGLEGRPGSTAREIDGGIEVTGPDTGDEYPLVGRELCLDRLSRHLDKADAGERRLVFVTGEAGAGKTALLRAFCNRIEARADVRVATGQCVEHHGSQEAFLPVLDALGKLCRSDDDGSVAAVLRQYAPTWLAQIPWLLRDSDRGPLAEDLLGATRSRMSREFGTFCEVVTRDRVTVLVLEDLHWCDGATVELLSWLASQQGPARLLTASVAGDVFCAGVLGAALGEEAEALDEACQHLVASGQFIRHFDLCELPDGSYADRYAFIHVLYRDGLSQSLSARRRSRLHQLIGAHKARVYAGSTHLIAAELVTHFEQAGNPLLAIRFLRESADNALARYANPEAVCYLTSALELLTRAPDGPRAELEPELLEQRGLVYQAMADMTAAVEDFERLVGLARASRRTDVEVSALLRLSSALSWSDRDRCLVAVDKARLLCRHVADDDLRLSTLGSCAYWNLLWRRWDERDAEDCLRAATFDRAKDQNSRSGATLARASYFLCLSSDYRQAADMADEGMSIALTHGDSSEYLLSLYFRCWALLHAGRWDLFIECVDERALRIADSNDHQLWNLLFSLLRSWLEESCGDFDAAYRSASHALARAERHDLPFGRLLGLVRLGFACQGLERDQEAYDAFARCEAWLAGERVLMDWIVSIPMHHGLSRPTG